MKIQEVLQENNLGKKYKIYNKEEFYQLKKYEEHFYLKTIGEKSNITKEYELDEILNMEFEEVQELPFLERVRLGNQEYFYIDLDTGIQKRISRGRKNDDFSILVRAKVISSNIFETYGEAKDTYEKIQKVLRKEITNE